MIRPDLSRVPLADLPGGPEPVVLCASAGLAASLRRAHGEFQVKKGAATWRALQSSTPDQWLDHLTSGALLRGDIPSASVSGTFLTRMQERHVWELAIKADAGEAGPLFDREGMARVAMEAAHWQRVWRIDVPEALHTEEYRAFLRWQERVAEACRAGGWRLADEVVAWRIGCIERGIGGLPERMGIAGFLDSNPVVMRLLGILEARGVELFRVDIGRGGGVTESVIGLPDAEAECYAAARWVRDWLAGNGTARVRLAVADLPARRRMLESVLDDVLHPVAVGARWAGQDRDYIFIAGSPLASESLIDVALRLLQLLVRPQRVAQSEFGALLCGMGWSADVDEADVRARLEAGLRECLPPEASLERLLRALTRLCFDAEANMQAPHLLAHLGILLESSRHVPRRQSLSAWGRTFAECLAALGWPGQRPLGNEECAACDRWREVLNELVALDPVLGRVDAGEALHQLQRQCRDHAFEQPRRTAPRLEICGLADALAGPVDALWVMGLNEGSWPPAPRPNPLLPAELQRRAGISAARADSLAVEAQELRTAWCESAGEVVFSWSQRDGERSLRRSPVLSPESGGSVAVASAAFHARGIQSSVTCLQFSELERIDDARAPPVGADERIRGGTSLLSTQAICPAWGFYQYRLGATALPAPTFGLDARARGSLLHAALEEFWRGRSFADLLQMDEVARTGEIRRVVFHALAEFDRRAVEPLSPRLRQLEVERLQTLLAIWLEVESRRVPFRVIACEERHELDIEGLPVRVVIDRIDQLDDGRLVVIDYKTGRNDSVGSWAKPRIKEPQLPIYAALAFPDRNVAAVALARVIPDGPGFFGVGEDEGLLPEVKSLAMLRKQYAEDDFPDWPALRRTWAQRITEVAREVRDGTAAVVFDDEKELLYCDVRPLLRLAERQQQFDEADPS